MSEKNIATATIRGVHQQQQQKALLNGITELRLQLDAKIQAAKEQLMARQTKKCLPAIVNLPTQPVTQPLPNQQPLTLPPPTQACPPPHRVLSAGQSEVRRQLRNKIERVRLDLDLLLAKQRCLQEQRKLQSLQQQQKQKQQQQKIEKRRICGYPRGSSKALLSRSPRSHSSPSKFKLRRSYHAANRQSVGARVLKRQSSSLSASLDPIRRSRNLVARAKLRLRKKRIYCVFYCRFGQCRKAKGCIYLHDSNMVAICKRFLKRGGACDAGPGCRLSHCLDPAKLPACEFYESPTGCSRANCPYRHVRYAADTAVCQDFRLLGHCRRGVECPLRHFWATAPTKKCQVKSTETETEQQQQQQRSESPSYIPVPRHFLEDDEDSFGEVDGDELENF